MPKDEATGGKRLRNRMETTELNKQLADALQSSLENWKENIEVENANPLVKVICHSQKEELSDFFLSYAYQFIKVNPGVPAHFLMDDNELFLTLFIDFLIEQKKIASKNKIAQGEKLNFKFIFKAPNSDKANLEKLLDIITICSNHKDIISAIEIYAVDPALETKLKNLNILTSSNSSHSHENSLQGASLKVTFSARISDINFDSDLTVFDPSPLKEKLHAIVLNHQSKKTTRSLGIDTRQDEELLNNALLPPAFTPTGESPVHKKNLRNSIS